MIRLRVVQEDHNSPFGAHLLVFDDDDKLLNPASDDPEMADLAVAPESWDIAVLELPGRDLRGAPVDLGGASELLTQLLTAGGENGDGLQNTIEYLVTQAAEAGFRRGVLSAGGAIVE